MGSSGDPALYTGCPEAETLAAFVDGRLAAAERGAVVAHLAECAGCREVVAEALHLERELALDGGEPAKVVRHPRSRRWGTLLGVAAGLTVVVGLPWLYRHFAGPPAFPLDGTLRSADLVAELPLGSGLGAASGERWEEPLWPTFRGPGARLNDPQAEFELGARLVQLRLAAELGEQDRAAAVADALLRPLQAIPLADNLVVAYQELAKDLRGGLPATELTARVAAAEQLADASFAGASRRLDFGKWAEAGRLAALAGDRAYFRGGSLARSVERLRRLDPGPAIVRQLDRLAAAARGGVEERELGEIGAALAEIVRHRGVDPQRGEGASAPTPPRS